MSRFKAISLSILKYILYLAGSLLLALVIRLFLCNFYTVPTDSMEPAILPGDFILAGKLAYGARIFTGLKFDRNTDPPMMHVSGLRSVRRNVRPATKTPSEFYSVPATCFPIAGYFS